MEIENILKALGEPMRLKIFKALLERKHCVRSLSKKLNISESAVSQHLKIMKEAELVYGEKFGYHTHYFPMQTALNYIFEEIEKMKKASEILDRDNTQCLCEYRKEEKK